MSKKEKKNRLVLIDEKEKLVATIEGIDFYYRRIPDYKRIQLLTKHRDNKGKTEDTALVQLASEIVEYGVVGWDKKSIIDGNGNEVEFSKSSLKKLPTYFRIELSNKIMGGDLENEIVKFQAGEEPADTKN